MNTNDVEEIGRLIRKRRKELGLTLIEVERRLNGAFSRSGINRIEHGKIDNLDRVKFKKLLRVLKLRSLDDYKEELRIRDAELRIKLISIESLIDSRKIKAAKSQLKQIQLDKDHPLSVVVKFLKAKIYRQTRKYEQAEKLYKSLLPDSDQHPNLTSCIYNDISFCQFRQNKAKDALVSIDRGINCCDRNGERSYIYEVLYYNKINYLKHMGWHQRAMDILEEIWDEVKYSTSSIYNMYSLKISLSIELGRDPLIYALEAVEILQKKGQPDTLARIWIHLGDIFRMRKWYSSAETCYETATSIASHTSETMAHALLNYAELMIEMNHEQAEELLVRALDIAKKNKYRYYCAKVYWSLSKIKDDGNEKVIFLQKALKQSKNTDFLKLQHDILVAIVEIINDNNEERRQYLEELHSLQNQLKKGGFDIG